MSKLPVCEHVKADSKVTAHAHRVKISVNFHCDCKSQGGKHAIPLSILSTQSGRLWLLPTLSVCVSVCVSVCLSVCLCVCPAFTAYISLTMSRMLINLGESVGTSVRLIVLRFHKNQFSIDVIMTSFLFSKVISKRSNSAQRETTLCKGKQLCCARL